MDCSCGPIVRLGVGNAFAVSTRNGYKKPGYFLLNPKEAKSPLSSFFSQRDRQKFLLKEHKGLTKLDKIHLGTECFLWTFPQLDKLLFTVNMNSLGFDKLQFRLSF